MPPTLRLPPWAIIQLDSVAKEISRHSHNKFGAFEKIAVRQVEAPTGPDAPRSHGQGGCSSGWSCLTQGQQFGIIFSIVIVVLAILATVIYCR